MLPKNSYYNYNLIAISRLSKKLYIFLKEFYNNYLPYKTLGKLKKVYKTYANEDIDIAIKKPFNLIEIVEKRLRSSIL